MQERELKAEFAGQKVDDDHRPDERPAAQRLYIQLIDFIPPRSPLSRSGVRRAVGARNITVIVV